MRYNCRPCLQNVDHILYVFLYNDIDVFVEWRHLHGVTKRETSILHFEQGLGSWNRTKQE